MVALNFKVNVAHAFNLYGYSGVIPNVYVSENSEENLSLDAYSATLWALKTSTGSCLSPQSFVESAFTTVSLLTFLQTVTTYW